MGQARHPLSLALALLALGVAALPIGGCGSSGEGTNEGMGGSATSSNAPPGAAAQGCTVAVRGVSALRVSGAACASGRSIVAAWSDEDGCRVAGEASRTSCTVAGYRCLSASAQSGLAVSCARPGRSISFIARRG